MSETGPSGRVRRFLWPGALAGIWLASWLVLRETAIAPGLAAGTVGWLVIGGIIVMYTDRLPPRFVRSTVILVVPTTAFSALGGSFILLVDSIQRGPSQQADGGAFALYALVSAMSLSVLLFLPNLATAIAWTIGESRDRRKSI